MPGLHDAPHRLAQVAHDLHQPEAGQPAGRHRTEVRDEQGLVAGPVELVVDGEVAEVEVAVVHARVLPVEQPEAAVRQGQEVGGEQVVVTGARRLGAPGEGRPHPLGHGHGPVVGVGDRRPRGPSPSPRSPGAPGTSRRSA